MRNALQTGNMALVHASISRWRSLKALKSRTTRPIRMRRRSLALGSSHPKMTKTTLITDTSTIVASNQLDRSQQNGLNPSLLRAKRLMTNSMTKTPVIKKSMQRKVWTSFEPSAGMSWDSRMSTKNPARIKKATTIWKESDWYIKRVLARSGAIPPLP